MANLKNETLKILQENGKSVDDVEWVGGDHFAISKEQFWKLADREYDDGYGSQEVAVDLKIVGNDWWLERHEDDGLEWWEFKTLPTKPKETKVVKRVIGRYWNTLNKLNEDEWEKENG